MSKRRLLELVQDGHVTGWDDPRMPTISGYRRRGYTPEAIRTFCERIGVAKADSVVDVALLESTLRDDLNARAPRAMAVLRPLKVVLENYPEGQTDQFEIPFHPDNAALGSRQVPFGRVLFIERDDYAEQPPKGWFRLSPGAEVRLRAACVIKCVEAIKDPATGEVTELRCTWDPQSRGGAPADGRKIKGTLHWVSAAHAADAEVRLYDRLFVKENPYDVEEGQDYRANLNPNSLETLTGCKLEPALAGAQPGDKFQFERLGYYCADAKDSKPGHPVFNQTVTLRDSWAKIAEKQAPAKPVAKTKPAPKPASLAAAEAEGIAPLSAVVTYDDFTKIDLRVAEVVAAVVLEGSQKLLQLTLDLGPLGRRRVFAGIAEHVESPQSVVGKKLVCVANLAPRQMRWGVSEGMIVAAVSKTSKGEHLALIEAPNGRNGEKLE
jgi:methionine--tRNA ligase beta chain